MKEQVLESIGLSKNETKIFLALLDIGQTTAGKITEKSGVHRTNVYDAVERLIEKGLVSYIIKNKIKYFEATDPSNLMNLIKEKEVQLKEIMPQLKLSTKLANKKGEAKIYEGVPAFMNILHSFLKYKEPILSYGIPKTAPEMLKTSIPHFHKARIAKKIQMNVIYNFDAQDRINKVNKISYTDARFIDDKFRSLVSTNICGDEVVLALWTKPIIIIQIKNKQIADAYKHYFEFMWTNAIK